MIHRQHILFDYFSPWGVSLFSFGMAFRVWDRNEARSNEDLGICVTRLC